MNGHQTPRDEQDTSLSLPHLRVLWDRRLTSKSPGQYDMPHVSTGLLVRPEGETASGTVTMLSRKIAQFLP